MGCVKAANEFVTLDQRESWDFGIVFEEREGDVLESLKRGRSDIDNPPQLRSAEVSAHVLEGVAVIGMRGTRKTSKVTNSVPNVQASYDVSIYQLTKDVSAGESFLLGKGLGIFGFLGWTIQQHEMVDLGGINGNDLV